MARTRPTVIKEGRLEKRSKRTRARPEWTSHGLKRIWDGSYYKPTPSTRWPCKQCIRNKREGSACSIVLCLSQVCFATGHFKLPITSHNWVKSRQHTSSCFRCPGRIHPSCVLKSYAASRNENTCRASMIVTLGCDIFRVDKSIGWCFYLR